MKRIIFSLGTMLIFLALPGYTAPESFRCGSFPLLDDAMRKEERAHRLLKRAIACVQEGRPQESISIFSELIGLDPNNATAYLNRGNAYLQTGQFELGLADYSHVIAKNPDLFQAWYNRGTAFVAARQYDRAIADLTEAIRLKPDEARAYCKENELPVIGCCCPACGDLSLQRQRVKRLIMELEREHPSVKASMIKALANVMPRHLLDRRLNPVAPLRETAATRLEELADLPADVRLIPLMLSKGVRGWR